MPVVPFLLKVQIPTALLAFSENLRVHPSTRRQISQDLDKIRKPRAKISVAGLFTS